MAKTQMSVRVEMQDFVVLRELSNKAFHGNMSATVEWVIRCVMHREKFYSFMAKLHAAQMNNFIALAEQERQNSFKVLEQEEKENLINKRINDSTMEIFENVLRNK